MCDADRNTLEGVKKAYPGVRVVRRHEELLEDAGLAAVLVAAPAAQHYALARDFLRAGKDVFVEKPLALNVPEAEELVEIARSGKRILMVGHLLEYHPAIRKLKDLVASGELGEVHYVYSNRLNLGKVRKEENILWSFAPHDISVILLLLGSFPEWASTTGASYLQRGVPDVTMTCLDVPRGRPGPRVRELAPPLQGAEARGHREPQDGRVRRRRERGQAQGLRQGNRVAERRARGRGRRPSRRCTCPRWSPFARSWPTSSTACGRVARPAPTGRTAFASSACWTRASGP